jgi:hypothetical protein
MFRIDGGRAPRYCDGISRRSFLQVGVAGMASVGLAGVARAVQAGDPAAKPKKDTSVILLWLDGGAGHMDTWDMKPEAPAEYRGIWRPIKTNVPAVEPEQDHRGVLLRRGARVAPLHRPRHAREADRRQPRDAHLEKAAATDPVAIPRRAAAVDAEHAWPPDVSPAQGTSVGCAC